MTKLFYIVTVPETAYSLLRGQLAYFRQQTLDVAVISSDGPLLWDTKDREQVTIHPLPLEREIKLYADIHALLAMIVLLRREKPEIVNASTPKAGFIGMIASRFCNVPVRIYQLRGLRLETATGFLRVLLLTAERIAAWCAQVVVCDSQSLRDRYLSLGLAPAHKVRVLGAGSGNGVDPDRFLPSALVLERAHQHRDELRLPPDNLVIGYVGRLTRDKGVGEMVTAFLRLTASIPNLKLLLIGVMETGSPIAEETRTIIAQHPAIYSTGFVKDPAPYYHLMHVFCFPSHREGLPNAPLEAALAGLPIVGFRATGTVDVVRNGETGFLVEIGNIDALTSALETVLHDEELRRQLGLAGQRWVLENFPPKVVWQQLHALYDELLPAH